MFSTKVRPVFKGKAERHFEYITRSGPFSPRPFDARTGRPEKFTDLVSTGGGNMPTWVIDEKIFWQLSDRYERANGTSARSVMFALPREVEVEGLIALVEAFCRRRFGKLHAFVWAIHNPKAAFEEGDHPHVHIMFCERIIDERPLPADRYFSRVNRQDPSRGGHAKIVFGSMWERYLDLIRLRGEVADLINDYLEANDVERRVTHLSYADRGIPVEPEKWIGRSVHPLLKQRILEARRVRRAVVAAYEELADVAVEMRAGGYDVPVFKIDPARRITPAPVRLDMLSDEDDEAAEQAYLDALEDELIAEEQQADAFDRGEWVENSPSDEDHPNLPDDQPDPSDE